MKISAPEPTEDIQVDIEDIDRADFDNPQLVAEYINDIYHNMRQLEVIESFISNSLVMHKIL